MFPVANFDFLLLQLKYRRTFSFLGIIVTPGFFTVWSRFVGDPWGSPGSVDTWNRLMGEFLREEPTGQLGEFLESSPLFGGVTSIP